MMIVHIDEFIVTMFTYKKVSLIIFGLQAYISRLVFRLFVCFARNFDSPC